MVKTGKFYIKQPSTSGRIGENLGRSLAEQLPKAVEQGRLAYGLNQFEQNAKGLTPLQQATQLFSIPGITPQMVQALPELIKQQQTRDIYQNRPSYRDQTDTQQSRRPMNLDEVQFGQLPGQIQRQNFGLSEQPNTLVGAQETGQPQVNPTNPTRPEALPGIPLTPEEFKDLVGDYARQFPLESPQDWERRALQDEERMLSRPEAVQKYDKYLRDKREEIQNEFNNELERHLQKSGTETFQDIPGDLQSDMLRTIERRIKENPRLSTADAVKQGVEELFQFSKAKKNIDTLATKPFYEFLTPAKKKSNYEKLKTYSDIYDKLNRNDELYQKLITHTNENGVGFGLSPQAAASIAYPIEKIPELKKYISGVKPQKSSFNKPSSPGLSGFGYSDTAPNAVSHAINIEPFLKIPKASPLAIAKELKKKDPLFNEHAFFDQLRLDNRTRVIKLDPWQENQLPEGESEIFPNWGDLWYLPLF